MTLSSSEKKVVGFVSSANPFSNRKAWSGTLFKIREAIERAGFDVVWIQSKPNSLVSFALNLFLKLPSKGWYEHTKLYTKACARSIDLGTVKKCDYLLFPGGAQMLYYLKKECPALPPVIYYTDACFHQMVGYYWRNIPHWIYKQAEELEQYGLDTSDIVIRSSNWALNCAIEFYGCNPKKTEVLEFGANIDAEYIKENEPYTGGELRILFSGVNWKRKGGDIAIDTTRKLNEDGFQTKLFLVGLERNKIPEEYQNQKSVEYVGDLNKNKLEEYEKYVELFSKCHCVLLPTKAECSSIVLCEAAAFGLPAFTYDTGGLGNYVINGKTGYRLDPNAKAGDFANKIEEAIRNKEFETLHNGSLSYYRERISWEAWSRRFKHMMDRRFDNNRNPEKNTKHFVENESGNNRII